MEENRIVDLDLGEVEEIENMRNGVRRPYPVAYVSTSNIYFNTPAMKMMGHTKFMEYGCTTQYIVVTPTDTDSNKAFRVCNNRRSSPGVRTTALPVQLKRKKIGQGVYRLVPAGNGRYAFDRYAPIVSGEAVV